MPTQLAAFIATLVMAAAVNNALAQTPDVPNSPPAAAVSDDDLVAFHLAVLERIADGGTESNATFY